MGSVNAVHKQVTLNIRCNLLTLVSSYRALKRPNKILAFQHTSPNLTKHNMLLMTRHLLAMCGTCKRPNNEENIYIDGNDLTDKNKTKLSPNRMYRRTIARGEMANGHVNKIRSLGFRNCSNRRFSTVVIRRPNMSAYKTIHRYQ